MKQNASLDRDMSRRDFVATSATALAGLMFVAAPVVAGAQPSQPADPKLIDDLVLANRVLAEHRIVDAFGHVSARHNSDPNRYLLARDLAPALVTAADIMEFDLDSNPIDAKGRSIYQERFIHGEIYKARPDVKAVVHAHTTSVIPFSLSKVPLQPVFHMAGFIVKGVPVFNPARDAGIHRVLVASPESGYASAA